MEEQVPELVDRAAIVTRLYGVSDLVGLLDEIGEKRARSLLAIPGAAVGPAQPTQQREHALEARLEGRRGAGSLGLAHGART